jgi:CheY-like chemotaxis protein
MKILVIDDEPLIRRALQKAFQKKNYEVQLAQNGAEGLELWRKYKPDIVFLDIIMPGMNGWRVLQEISRSEEKVVVMSAYTGDEAQKKSNESKYDLFLSKPFESIEEVVGIVEAWK